MAEQEPTRLHPIDAARLIMEESRQQRRKYAFLENFNLIKFTQHWLRGRERGRLK